MTILPKTKLPFSTDQKAIILLTPTLHSTGHLVATSTPMAIAPAHLHKEPSP